MNYVGWSNHDIVIPVTCEQIASPPYPSIDDWEITMFSSLSSVEIDEFQQLFTNVLAISTNITHSITYFSLGNHPFLSRVPHVFGFLHQAMVPWRLDDAELHAQALGQGDPGLVGLARKSGRALVT